LVHDSTHPNFDHELFAMDVFLMIRRHKMTVFLDAKENTTVLELKRMIEGITKKPPSEQRLYNKDEMVRIPMMIKFI